MTIKINITDQNTEQVKDQAEDTVKIEIVKKDKVNFKLMSRSAINGDIMILDHKDIDIVLKKGESKIITFAKETMSDFTYGAESRLLEFLRKRGILEYDSIQGGNIYGSLEGKLMESDDTDVHNVALMVISEWMSTEDSYMKGTTAYDEMEDEHIISPDGEYSTELGEVPAAERKGSINQRTLFAPYLYGRYTYE
jgi:hypothetical protein